MESQDIITEKAILRDQVIETKRLIKELIIADQYLVYLIKDVCNYRLNPNRETADRLRKNLEIFISKTGRLNL